MSTPMSRAALPRRRSRPSARAITAGVLALLLLLWIADNRDEVQVSFLVEERSLPLWVALAIAALVGTLAGLLLGRRRYRR